MLTCLTLAVVSANDRVVLGTGSRARQGLAVLMASAVVVLKHETSTLRQRHNFISIDFKYGVGDITFRRSPTLTKLVRVR